MSGQVNVLTQHNDVARTGANLNETVLNTQNVAPYSFGKLYEYPVSGQVYAQPLYATGVQMAGKGTRNVLFVATMHNTVYAFDADDSSQSSNLFWVANLGPPVTLPDPQVGIACGTYNDITTEIGILSTPYIDLTTKTMYIVAKTKENGVYIDRIHALDIITGAEKNGSPVLIQGSVPGSGSGSNNGIVSFLSANENQRSSLVLSNGIVYVCFAGYCDTPPYHGWIFGYDTSTLSQKIIFNTTPSGEDGGIWMSGQGPAVDTSGDIYVITGNGTFNPAARDFGDCFLRLRPSGSTLQVVDYFAPYNQADLEQADLDLGSDGPLLIPGTGLVTGSGKEGVVYLLDRNNLGKFGGTRDTCLQKIKTFNGVLHGSTVYWPGPPSQGMTYWWSVYDRLKAFHLNNGLYDQTPYLLGPQAPNMGYPGGMLSVSSNGNDPSSAILWATIPVTADASHSTVDGMLRAFDATNLTRELWNSEQLTTRDRLGKFAKFCSPTITNGKVYTPTFSNKVVVYGVVGPAKLRDPENPVDVVNGVDYQYYEGEWNYLPDFSAVFPVKSGNATYPDLSQASRQEDFALNYTGFIDVPTDGYYTFYLNSDDGSKFYIGDLALINNDGLHAPNETSSRIGLKAGRHVFSIAFFQKSGDKALSLSYEGPGIAKQLVPPSKLYRINAPPYEVKLYPNPTYEKITLFCGSSIRAGSDIMVYNSLGQRMLKTMVMGNTSEINTSALPSGIYNVHIVVDGHKITRTFIKVLR